MLDQITITNIDNIYTCNAYRGRRFTMENRKNFGLSFCQSGCITYTHKGKQYVSDPAHVILLPKGGNYSWHCSEAGFFPTIQFSCTEDFHLEELLVFPLKNQERTMMKVRKLQDMYFNRKDRTGCLSILYGLLSSLGNRQPVRSVLTPAMEYLNEHFSNPDLNNSMLSEIAGISEIYFRELFRESYGMSPKQFVLDMRLNLAQQLLSETNDSIGEIAERCGFTSVYYFSRFFHKTMGKTPTEYRRENRKRGI